MKNRSGIGKLTILIFGTILFVVGWSAYHIMPFYYYFFELKNNMEQLAQMAGEFEDEEIRKKIKMKIKELEIPADPERLIVSRYDGIMKISLPYEEVLYFTWDGKDHDLYVFKFLAEAERRY